MAIADLIEGDADNDSLLENNELRIVVDLICRFLSLEKNLRGWDNHLGWVHAVAHVADCFNALISHPKLGENEVQKCVVAILSYIENRGNSVFKWGEDFRLGRPLANAILKLEDTNLEEVLFSRYSLQKLLEIPSLQNFLCTFRCVYLELPWKNSERTYAMSRLEQLVR